MWVLSFAVPMIFVALGLAEFVHPFGPPLLRNSPILLVIFGLLLAGRHAARLTARRRAAVLNEVPKKPLGLSDEES